MKVIYMTGAPASGKSTTLRMLNEANPSIFCFEYGEELTKYINNRDRSKLKQTAIRKHSSKVIKPEDIDALDDELLGTVRALRGKRPIIIDSHPVTKESFGFRVTAFSAEKVKELNPDEIWVLFVPPETTRDRILEMPLGRPLVSIEEARMHTFIQSSVATNYGIISGKPVYFFDANRSQDELLTDLLERLEE